jgi:hypothetical protein
VISGLAKTGDDERERGNRRAVPLRIDGSRGNWYEIEELWPQMGVFRRLVCRSNSGSSTR